LASLHWSDGDLPGAIKYYRRALVAHERQPSVWFNLGLALESAGETDEAVGAFQEACKLAPTQLTFIRYFHSLLKRHGRYDEALALLEKAAAASPERVEIWLTLADLATEMWRLVEAEEAYGKALELRPDLLRPKVQLAMLLAKQGRYATAEQRLDEIIASEPAPGLAKVALGEVLTALGRTDDARELLAEAAREVKDSSSVAMTLCVAALQSGRHLEAVTSAQMALSSGRPEAYYLLVRSFIAAGDMDKATRAAENMSELFAGSHWAKLATARVLEREGKAEEAVRNCEEAIALHPYSVEALKLGGRLSVQAQQPEHAAELWARALELNRWDAELHWQMAELLRTRLDRPAQAVSHYRRHIDLGGIRSEQARRRIQDLQQSSVQASGED